MGQLKTAVAVGALQPPYGKCKPELYCWSYCRLKLPGFTCVAVIRMGDEGGHFWTGEKRMQTPKIARRANRRYYPVDRQDTEAGLV